MIDRLFFFLLPAVCIAATAGCAKGLPADNPSRGGNAACVASRTSAAEAINCRTVIEPYIRYDDPDAVVFNDLPVQLYFSPQAPPQQTEILQPIQVKSVVSAQNRSCRDAGIEGLLRLQRLAKRSGANAVVNIRSTWDRERLGDELYFGCRVTRGRYALVWEGTLARTAVPQADPAEAPAANLGPKNAEEREEAAVEAQVQTRLRKLDALYYQGLLSREEYLDRRKHILDAL